MNNKREDRLVNIMCHSACDDIATDKIWILFEEIENENVKMKELLNLLIEQSTHYWPEDMINDLLNEFKSNDTKTI